MDELCQGVLDGFGMPGEWVLSIVTQFFRLMGICY